MKIAIKTSIYFGQAAKIVMLSIAIQLILTLWEVTNVFVYVSVAVSDNRQMREPFALSDPCTPPPPSQLW